MSNYISLFLFLLFEIILYAIYKQTNDVDAFNITCIQNEQRSKKLKIKMFYFLIWNQHINSDFREFIAIKIIKIIQSHLETLVSASVAYFSMKLCYHNQ